MKVALVGFDFGEYCIRLASGIAYGDQATVLLFLPDDEADPFLHLLSGPVTVRRFHRPRIRQPLRQLRMIAMLVRQIRSFQPDLIHLQLGHFWFNLLALPLLRRYPLVLTVHDSLTHIGDAATGKTPQWIYDRACFLARERIVHAPQVKDLLVKRLSIPASTVHVVPHVVVGDVEANLGEKVTEEPEILFFGRIWAYKGLEYLIQAEPFITAQVPDAKIVIAGQGEDFTRYRRMMVHQDRFIVHNEFVSNEKRATLFRRSSVVVLPYIEASQSAVISMAYRYGKPVVATMVGGLPEMVDHGTTGFLVPPHNAEALADAVITLMQNKSMRRDFGQSGMRKVNHECSPELVGSQTRIVYQHSVRRGPIVEDSFLENEPSQTYSSRNTSA